MTTIHELIGDELMTADEVASLFRVTPKTVRSWARQGLMPVVLTPGNRVLFRKSIVDKMRDTP